MSSCIQSGHLSMYSIRTLVKFIQSEHMPSCIQSGHLSSCIHYQYTCQVIYSNHTHVKVHIQSVHLSSYVFSQYMCQVVFNQYTCQVIYSIRTHMKLHIQSGHVSGCIHTGHLWLCFVVVDMRKPAVKQALQAAVQNGAPMWQTQTLTNTATHFTEGCSRADTVCQSQLHSITIPMRCLDTYAMGAK